MTNPAKNRKPELRPAEMLALFVIYVASAWLGVKYASVPGSSLGILWLPSGIALIGVAKMRRYALPVIFAASYMINISDVMNQSSLTLFISALLSVIPALTDTLQPVLAYYFLKQLNLFNPFEKGSMFVRFLFYVVSVPCLLASVINTLFMLSIGAVSGEQLSAILLNMSSLFFSDSYGIILIYILYKAADHIKTELQSKKNIRNAVFSTALLTVSAVLSFFYYPEFIYAVFPALLFITVLSGLFTYAVNMFILTGVAFYATISHSGPFAYDSIAVSYITLIIFLVFSNITFLYLITLIGELGKREKQLEKIAAERGRDLIETETHYKLLFNTSAVGMTITTNEGTIISANPVICNLLGYKENELKEIPIQNFYTDVSDRDRIREKLEETGTVRDQEVMIKTKDDMILYVLLTMNYIYIERQQLILTNWSNITDRVEAERINREMQYYVEVFLRNAPIHLFMKDEENRALMLSNQFEQMLGKPLSELLGKTSEELFPPELAKKIHDDDSRVIREGRIFEAEEELNGKYYYTKKVPFKIGDKSYIIGFTLDKTKEKLNEMELVSANAMLTELNATKDKFFTIIAHDLKNPFQSLIGLSDILKEDYYEYDDDKRIEIIQVICESARNGFELLNNLLIWSRAKLNRLDFMPVRIDLFSLVNNEIKLIKMAASGKGITVENEIAPGFAISADENMIRTILRNLITNAVKFSYAHGTVSVSAELTGEQIRITVQDNGIGIQEENLEKLFRIDSTFTTPGTNNEQGTGLGLILCKEFVEKHNGVISVESCPGQGSKFSIFIPSQNIGERYT